MVAGLAVKYHWKYKVKYAIISKVYTLSGCGAVDSALGLGPRGRRFESFHPDHIERMSEMRFVFLLSSLLLSLRGYSFSSSNISFVLIHFGRLPG